MTFIAIASLTVALTTLAAVAADATIDLQDRLRNG